MTRDQVLVISTLENYRQAWDGTPIDKSDKRARLAPVIPESPIIQLVPRGGMHAVLVTGNDNSETKIVLGDSRRSFVPSSSTLPPAQPSLLCNMQLASLELMGNIPSADLHRSSTLSYADRARNTLHGLMAATHISTLAPKNQHIKASLDEREAELSSVKKQCTVLSQQLIAFITIEIVQRDQLAQKI
ncbi:unnamed protein product [Ilex paraguariensis]|uniref:Uncharacterized protein n=1 Tax=Ilex paraguariensis TaxID=185542 RepID=A0ABC8RPF9_9AQUA